MLLLVLLFIVIGDFMDAVPAIIIFMPIVIKLNELGNIKPLHMGVVHHHDAGVRADHAALWAVVAGGVEIRRRSIQPRDVCVAADLRRVLRRHRASRCCFPDVVLYLPKLLLPESVGCFKSPTGAGYICPP